MNDFLKLACSGSKLCCVHTQDDFTRCLLLAAGQNTNLIDRENLNSPTFDDFDDVEANHNAVCGLLANIV